MEGLLNELVEEIDTLEELASSKIPRGSDYALQWTLNRVVKKRADESARRIHKTLNHLITVVTTPKDQQIPRIMESSDSTCPKHARSASLDSTFTDAATGAGIGQSAATTRFTTATSSPDTESAARNVRERVVERKSSCDDSAIVVDTLQLLRRRIDHAMKLSQHSGVAVNFKQRRRKTLKERLAEVNGLTVNNSDSVTRTKEKKVKRVGENYKWLFQPPFCDGCHLIDPDAAGTVFRYSERLLDMSSRYVCRGLKYSECVEFVRFCKEWYKDPDAVTPVSSLYEAEFEAIEHVYAHPQKEDPWGYEIQDLVHETFFKISHPIPFAKLNLRDTASSATKKTAISGLSDNVEPPSKKLKNVHQDSGMRPAILVDNDADFLQFITKLLNMESHTEGQLPMVAMDVEFSAKSCFRGQVCLIQVSTYARDYLIDPLRISKPVMHSLNQITANPGILKVMHGIDHDVLWLQNDFGLFLVNVFDTFHASRALRIPGGNSLYNLVLHYCQIMLDKSVQLSDWRCRPLTAEQISYAREDTRYLLHIFTKMRNQILSLTGNNSSTDVKNAATSHFGRNQMLQVLHESHLVARRVNSWAPLNIDKRLDKLHQAVAGSSNPQTNALRLSAEVAFAWRDLKARDENETPSSIVTDVILYKALMKVSASVQCASAGARPGSKAQLCLKEALPGMPEANARYLQSLVAETLEKIENPNDVYVGMCLQKRTAKSTVATSVAEEAPPMLPSDDSVVASAPEATRPSKKRRTTIIDVDRLKSETADDGRLNVMPTAHESGLLEDDMEITIRGYYQTGPHTMACFEKKGDHTWRSSLPQMLNSPPWLDVFDGRNVGESKPLYKMAV